MVRVERVDFDLRGKDWLTEAEAAHYCGVSLSQFQAHSRGFSARRFMGKKLYSKNELFDAIQQAPLWHPMTRATVDLSAIYKDVDPRIIARLRDERIRPYKPRKPRQA